MASDNLRVGIPMSTLCPVPYALDPLPAPAGVFPMVSGDFEALTAAMERLTLNDASVTVVRETSNALGAGFRCGFALSST